MLLPLLVNFLTHVLLLVVVGFAIYYVGTRLIDYYFHKRPVSPAPAPAPAATPGTSADHTDTTGLRLQAYERLALLTERIALPSLLLRTRKDGMTANQLRAALLIGIQQEFEYNLTQQVYISGQLWQIIKLTRDDLSRIVSLAAEEGGTGREMADRLFTLVQNRENDPILTAQEAIRREATTVLG